nr:methyl-CpG-binding domain-containing protein 2 [Ipomoea batatas]
MQPGEHSGATSSSAEAAKVYPSILGYSFQCSKCSKWRLVPTKEIYENIRANISANPFFCEMVNQWERNISCEDPTDVAPDGSRLWAIDKPNIPLPPPGWRRELGFRAVGGTRFVEVYLKEHPEHEAAGININQFCFNSPQPLFENKGKRKHHVSITSLSQPHQSAQEIIYIDDDEDDIEVQGSNAGSAPNANSNS